MITRIEAKNYRCFADVGIDLGDFALLAGPNGAGKSTLLDIPALVRDMAFSNSLNDSVLMPKQRIIPRAQRLMELAHLGRGTFFSFALEFRLPQEVLRAYEQISTSKGGRETAACEFEAIRCEIQLEVFNETELQVASEYVRLLRPRTKSGKTGRTKDLLQREGGSQVILSHEGNGRKGSTRVSISPSMLGLAVVRPDPAASPGMSWFLQYLQSGITVLRPDPEKIRRAAPPGKSDFLLPDGSNLPWQVMRLQNEQPDAHDEWVAQVRNALPNVASIVGKERADDHFAYLEVGYRSGFTVTSSGISDGTARILALTILPYLPRPPKLLLVEEPENGVHPRALESILESLRAMYDSQVLVATQSPLALVRAAREEILCFRRDAGDAVSVISGAEHPRLIDWKGGIDLGSLFAAGVLD